MRFLKDIISLSIVSVILLNLFLSCSDSEEFDPAKEELELLSKHKLAILEPSGLAADPAGNALYTVSDHSNEVYKISLTGEVIKTYGYSGNDLEGVSFYKNNSLLLAEERQKTIVVYHMSDGTEERHPLSYNNNEENSGIEGVAYNSHDGSSFVLNEKNPGILMRLRADFSIVKTYNLDFASDYSGVFYDRMANELWIVSDQSKTINRCTLNGKRIKSYSVNINQAEGIVLVNNKIYVVSDADAFLYVYQLPQQ